MKTEELIRALAADRRQQPTVASLFVRYLPVAVAFAAILLLASAGLRPGLGSALLASPRAPLKILASAALAVAGVGLALRLAAPLGSVRPWRRTLLALATLVVGAVGIELWALPTDEWTPALRGTNATSCLMMIPALALAPLFASLAALRGGAPSRPVLAGAAAGLLAGGFGATLYALHCPDDSPLFVATWYSIGIAAVTAIGAAAGSRLLRW